MDFLVNSFPSVLDCKYALSHSWDDMPVFYVPEIEVVYSPLLLVKESAKETQLGDSRGTKKVTH
jgi:hypothetical protein